MNEIIEEYFVKKAKSKTPLNGLFQLIEKHYDILLEEKIAGLNVKPNKEPVNAGSIAEGIFILGLVDAMQNGKASQDGIINLITHYAPMVRGDTLEVDIDSANIAHFESQFDSTASVSVKFVIKLDPAQMAAMFAPLTELPSTIEQLAEEDIELLAYMSKIVSKKNTDWKQLADVILNPEIEEQHPGSRQKALNNLKNKKYDPLKRDIISTAQSVTGFWNRTGEAKRGYIDIVNDILNFKSSSDPSKTLKETGTTIFLVADGVSANLSTTADAYIRVGDLDTGETLFSYSLKKGSKQIAQTGGPGGKLKTTKEGDYQGGGIELMFVRLALPADEMPKAAKEFFEKHGAKPTREEHDAALLKGDTAVIQGHINNWNTICQALVSSLQARFGTNKAVGDFDTYELRMIAGLSVLITKTVSELDMEYVDIGKSAETTLRAFPGLLPNYVHHFDFSAFEGGGVVLQLPGGDGAHKGAGSGYKAIQPVVKIEQAYPVTRKNLEEGGYVIRLDEIRSILLQSPDYLMNILDQDNVMLSIFSKLPRLQDDYDTLKEKYQSSDSKDVFNNASQLAYREAVSKHYKKMHSAIELINDEELLEMIIYKLNMAMPKPGRKVFNIRIKARYKNATWRTILDKGRGLEDIMEFVKYAKWLKYEAGEAALKEIEDIIEASAKAISKVEKELAK